MNKFKDHTLEWINSGLQTQALDQLASNTAHIAQLFDGYNQLEAIKKQANRIDVYSAGLGAEVADLRKSVDENHNKFTR
jgi:uncharacterized protein YdcH (DUF465 family)